MLFAAKPGVMMGPETKTAGAAKRDEPHNDEPIKAISERLRESS